MAGFDWKKHRESKEKQMENYSPNGEPESISRESPYPAPAPAPNPDDAVEALDDDTADGDSVANFSRVPNNTLREPKSAPLLVFGGETA